ncbi:MAG: calcium-binding protein [Burkholderiales bacterium]|nr:calcium-binding protein [Burkholderiales bacterium]
MEGGAGSDTLEGGLGADTLVGGSGDDVYVAEAGDEIVELAGDGLDRVETWLGLNRTLWANVDNLRLLGDADVDGAGNGRSNLLEGNAGANRLLGLSGNDTLRGLAGDDTLTGGDGDDWYVIDAGGGADLIMESPDQGGVDTLQFIHSHHENIVVSKAGQHLSILATSVEGPPVQVLLKDWYANSQRPIEWVQWADGSSSSAAEIDQMANAGRVVDGAELAWADQWVTSASQQTPSWIHSMSDEDDDLQCRPRMVRMEDLEWWRRRDGVAMA